MKLEKLSIMDDWKTKKRKKERKIAECTLDHCKWNNYSTNLAVDI